MKCEIRGAQSLERALKIVNRHFRQRQCQELELAARLQEGDSGLLMALDCQLPPEGFRISMERPGQMQVSGGSLRGLIYGAGKMLRDGRFSDGSFAFGPWRGEDSPQMSVRGIYYASHFHNWHHVASEKELSEYTEDLALWGVNAVMAVFPAINLEGWNDPEAEPAIERLLMLGRVAHSLGLSYGSIASNTWFKGTPESIRATPLADPQMRRGNSGHPICPSNPDGMREILENCRRLFAKLAPAGLDCLCMWPYDEGGCECQRCRPWGSNGYYRMSKEISLLAKSFFPKAKTILSAWCFDTPPEGEWEGLSRRLAEEGGWLDYIMADAHEDFPEYPLSYPVPGNLRLLNFPEISMWGLWPWGGYGANPLPWRFQRLWNQAGSRLDGGFPYSEGIYEDVNKVIMSRFYWDASATAERSVSEYVSYECAPEAAPDAVRMIQLLEAAHMRFALAGCRERVGRLRGQPEKAAALGEMERLSVALEGALKERGFDPEFNPAAAEEAYALARKIDASLPVWAAKGWRWRMLYLRALLDRERLSGKGLETSAAEEALRELVAISHAKLEDDGSDPYHRSVRPPLPSRRASESRA